MIVVSNTSPIMNLAAVGQLNLLERLYGKIFIPKSVFQELSAISPEQLGGAAIQSLSGIETRYVAGRPLMDLLLLELDGGEAEAIALAMEMRADLILLDERQGRKVASRLGVKFIGLLGVLIEAKRKGVIVVKPVLDDLIAKAGFWVSTQLYVHVLREAGE